VSFARKVARKNLAKSGFYDHRGARVRGPEPVTSQASSRRNVERRSVERRGPEPKDVKGDIISADGNLQCHKCRRSDTLVNLRCEDFGASGEMKDLHDELAAKTGPGHHHVRCTACNQFMVYTLSEDPNVQT
jgi:hypothetical protein